MSPIHPLTHRRLPYKVEKIDISKNTQKEDWVSSFPLLTLGPLSRRNSFQCPVDIGTKAIGHHKRASLMSVSSNITQFLAINPNGRIPALTDTFIDGQKINLFESGGIMQYLVDRYDTEYKISFPKGTREYYEMNNWLFFQNAGVGPMQGQASKFELFLLLL
jgi:glutathione S-transferase